MTAETFGQRLRRERERRGVALEQIADSTKVSMALFEAMERNDVSRWPAGIFRRSFMRAYADAIGVDPDETVAEFLRLFPCENDGLFPDTPAAPPRSAAAGDTAAGCSDLRLQLAAEPAGLAGWRIRVTPAAGRRAAGDLVFALLFGGVGGLAAGAVGFWTATAVAALVYQTFGTLGLHSGFSPRPRRLQLDLKALAARAAELVEGVQARLSRPAARAGEAPGKVQFAGKETVGGAAVRSRDLTPVRGRHTRRSRPGTRHAPHQPMARWDTL